MAEEYRKRPLIGRLVFGIAFLVVGMTGLIIDLGGMDPGPSAALALLIGGVLLLAAIVAPRVRWPDVE